MKVTKELIELINHDGTEPILTQECVEITHKLPTVNLLSQENVEIVNHPPNKSVLTQECVEIILKVLPCYTDMAAECDFVF